MRPIYHIILYLQLIYIQFSQTKRMKEDPTLDYEDMFAGLTDEVMKNIFIRFYSMEEYFQVGKPQPGENLSVEPEADQMSTPKSIYFLFNKLIHQSISKIFVMNRLIYTKAKEVHSLLENGFDISGKKNSYWNFFLEDEQFFKIKEAYNLVSPQKKKIIKYAVLSISNILLKLSINMSKISVIPLQKFMTFERLNIPILSIIFLQFLQYRLLVVKKNTDITQDSAFLKQLPKITVIRLGKYKNNTQMDLLETSQFNLFTNKNKLQAPVRNLQFIDIHEFDRDPFYPNYQRVRQYEHILSLSLQKIGGGSIKSPFTFEILFLMETLVHPLVREFRPDIILYMEEYPMDEKIMNEQYRGLMISQLTEQTACQKIYVFKEMGFSKEQILKEYLENGEIITQQMAQAMEKIENQHSLKMKKSPDLYNLKKAQKIILDDLCFISLALIQKTSFDNALDASHRHIYPYQFLDGLLNKCESLKSQITNANESFSRAMDQKKFALKNMKDMTKILSNKDKEMVDENEEKHGFHIINLMNSEEHFTYFYDLLNNKKEALMVQDRKFKFGEEDNLYVKYYPDRLLVFITKSLKNHVEMSIFSKKCEDQKLFLLETLKFKKEQNDIQGTTYIASDNFLYRGFGKFKYLFDGQGQPKYNTSIHRLRIFPQLGNEWELVGTQSSFLNSTGASTVVPNLQSKIYGYGIFNRNEKAPNKNIVMFLGGYMGDSLSEQKISTKLYMIKDPQAEKIGNPKQAKNIISIGKTNKVLFSGINQHISKVFLHPFVFGIPFYDKSIFVLNGNGNYIHLNNTNKIFGTEIKVSPIQAYNGITNQYKIKLPNESAEQASEVIILAELLTKLLVFSSNQVNCLGSEACIQTLEEGLVKMKADLSNKQSKQLKIKPEDELFETNETFSLTFI